MWPKRPVFCQLRCKREADNLKYVVLQCRSNVKCMVQSTVSFSLTKMKTKIAKNEKITN